MKRLRILYVSPCEPVDEGSGSQQRSFVAVQALRRLGDVYHLAVPVLDEAAVPAPSALCVRVLSGAELVAAEPELWRPLRQPSRCV